MCCLSLSSYGQIGIQGGGNLTSLQIAPKPGTVLPIPTLQVGCFYDVFLTDYWCLTPGLKYVGKGASYKYTIDILGYKREISGTLHLRYLEIPLDIAYKTDSGWFVGGGLYVAFGINAGDIQFGSLEEDANPLDYGVSLKMGKRIDDTSVTLSYSQGLGNISQIKNTIGYNSVFGLSVGHHFIQNR